MLSCHWPNKLNGFLPLYYSLHYLQYWSLARLTLLQSNHPQAMTPMVRHPWEPKPQKRRKRPNKLHRAEISAKEMMKEVIEGQEKAKRWRHDLKERRLAQEAKCERAVSENERNWQFMAKMTSMMAMMSQYMGAAFHPPVPMPLMPSSYRTQPPFCLHHIDCILLGLHHMNHPRQLKT